jgi:hypothetical protein
MSLKPDGGSNMDLREKFIVTNGIKLHVMEAGLQDGPMVLFLHGFPEFWYAWRKQINYFVEKGYLVVAPDQRGYNLSDKPIGIASYKTDELAKDVIGLIDHYGRDQVFLVGHDWGAAVSWWTAGFAQLSGYQNGTQCSRKWRPVTGPFSFCAQLGTTHHLAMRIL